MIFYTVVCNINDHSQNKKRNLVREGILNVKLVLNKSDKLFLESIFVWWVLCFACNSTGWRKYRHTSSPVC